MQTVDILVAKSDIGLGQSVKPDDLQWQAWPAATASGSFISRASKADAIKEITGSIARSPFIAGEPIREQKLVKADGSGFMAAILPQGFRAVSTEISPETGAGGFILPNDRVDVLLTKRDKNPDGKGADVAVSEIILSNIRVLAIDQAPKEKEGCERIGRPDGHARAEARADRDARPLAPERHAVAGAAQHRRHQDATRSRWNLTDKRGESLNVVRYGVASQQTMQK